MTPSLTRTAGAATYRRGIPSEERVLQRTFGSDDQQYAATVHRWFGRSSTDDEEIDTHG